MTNHWNYRIVRTKVLTEDDDYWYTIHEAYYGEKGNIEYITKHGTRPAGSTLKELRKDWCLIELAFTKAIIDSEFPFKEILDDKSPIVLDPRVSDETRPISIEPPSWYPEYHLHGDS